MLPPYQKYIIWDCETERLNLHYNLPWELSWVIYNGNKLISEHERFIDIPDLSAKLSPIVKKLTHFNEERYNDLKKPAAAIYEEFNSYLSDKNYINIGQNILNFDIYILNNLRRFMGLSSDYNYLDRSIDTRPLGIAWKEGLPKPNNNESFINWQYKILNDRNLKAKASLKALAKALNVKYSAEKHHSGIYDVKLTFDVFWELKNKLSL